MGTYVNPGNESFMSAVRSDIYIDKTAMLEILNNKINTEKRYFAVSRARRFGKSMAAGMIDAYYSRGCDSHGFFSKYEIAKKEDFEKYLNKYNVLYFDVNSFLCSAKRSEDVIPLMDGRLLDEMIEIFPYLDRNKRTDIAYAVK